MSAGSGLETLHTARLRGERVRPEHAGEFARLHRDPRVARTLGGVPSDARLGDMLRAQTDHWEAHGYGLWIFHAVADGRFVGRAGLHHASVEGRPELELAYALLPEFWGSGLATEMGVASLGVAFDALAQPEVVAFTLPSNGASRRVMEKLGFGYERDIVHAGLPHVLYRLRACERSEPA